MRPDFSFLQSRQGGFGLVAAMFVIIVIAGAIAAMARMSETQSATSSMAIQQARAYQAARAGIEWGIHRAMADLSCEDQFTLEGFEVEVKCDPPAAAVSLPEEDRSLHFISLQASAQYASPGSPDHVYRQLSAVVEKND
ncbi:pilus assembly protein MshP [Stutzerimonas chloritidismutans]|uniref:pilus assembly protein MshP n=1 Tax=Stutzerimonas chloritidismutans TaxID=203192 RepID=UPI001D18A0C2|nr:pilus assembly protein MshP [Stutzerimonas chloritidismutans]UEG62631.1 pilus assembly protein MshP [Stutzerimonas chloritidismutans]